MTTPQDLADRLEKALDEMRNGLTEGSMRHRRMVVSNIVNLNSVEILASLRAVALAPADQSDIPLWAHWSSASAMTASDIDKQFKIIETRRAELAAELKFRGRPPADQSDAGHKNFTFG